MFNVGDYVTRKSYNNDIIFKIIDIKGDIYYLKGVSVRLYADSYVDDLVLCKDDYEADSFRPSIDEYRDLNRNEYFYLPGRILHLDGDQDYLEKCMSFYKKNKIRAYGLYMKEEEMASQVLGLLKKYKPDILVLTGHDSFSRSKREKYKNTSSFVNAVNEAREYEKSHEKLFIIAGACQSNYENLIKAGANFASSPKRINIHALDPAIVAACLSFSDKNSNIDIIKILDKTKYGASGMGGIITKGSMYIGYPR
ncbi:MAG: sporulation peptidase YabG [Bacilli bacterium]